MLNVSISGDLLIIKGEKKKGNASQGDNQLHERLTWIFY